MYYFTYTFSWSHLILVNKTKSIYHFNTLDYFLNFFSIISRVLYVQRQSMPQSLVLAASLRHSARIATKVLQEERSDKASTDRRTAPHGGCARVTTRRR